MDLSDMPAHGRLTRRRFMAAASALAVPFLAGCRVRPEDAEVDELTVALCDALARRTASECVGDYAEREYAGLAEAVKSATGVTLKFRRYRYDEQLIAAVAGGDVDAVIGKTWTVLRAARGSGRDYERLADVPGPTGARLLRGVFIARKDGPVRTIEDVSDCVFALATDATYESSHQARASLAAAGARPGESVEIGSCLNVAAMVWERQADAGVVSDYCVDHSGLQLTGDPEAFRVIGRTDGVPFVTIAVGDHVPQEARERVRRALLSLTDARVPEDLHTTGLIRPVPWSPEELA